MRIRIVGPRDVIDASAAAVATVRSLGTTAAAAAELVPVVEQLVGRGRALVEAAEGMVPRVEQVLEAATTVARAASPARVRAAAELVDRLDATLTPERVDAVADLADRLSTTLTPERVDDLGRLLDVLTPERADALARLVDRAEQLLSDERTRGLSGLADQAGRVAGALRAGELPPAAALRRMPGDIHAVLELIDDVHQVVTGMPGAARAMDRGAEPHPRVEE